MGGVSVTAIASFAAMGFVALVLPFGLWCWCECRRTVHLVATRACMIRSATFREMLGLDLGASELHFIAGDTLAIKGCTPHQAETAAVFAMGYTAHGMRRETAAERRARRRARLRDFFLREWVAW